MTALNSTQLKALTDAAADAVGREIARLRSEAAREEELRAAEHRARSAELETKILSAAGLEKELRDRLEGLKDGDPGKDGRDGVDGVDGTNGTDGRDGNDVEDISVVQDGATVQLAFMVGEVRSEFEFELPAGPPGNDGKEGPQGKIASVEPWTDEVQYEGAIRTHAGSTWQAVRDTAKEPPHADWICIAERGADGSHARSFHIRDTWDAGEDYAELDVVSLNGASFAARHDNPGECPGPGWKLLASQGKRGKDGERGRPGERGLPGPAVKEMSVDDAGMLTLTNADGTTAQCDFYPLLERLTRKGL